MSLTESMEMLNAALMAQKDIKYRGTIKAKTTDYPTFSDEQLSEMDILFRGFNGYFCGDSPITKCRGYRMPYVEDREYKTIEGVCTVIRYGDTLVIIEDDSMGSGNRWAKSERL